MTTENQKTILDNSDGVIDQTNTPNVPADNELFDGGINEADSKTDSSASAVFPFTNILQNDDHAQKGLSVQEVFAGDDNFYRYLTDLTKPAEPEKPVIISQPELRIPYKRFSTVQKVLAGSIVFIVLMLLYMLRFPSSPNTGLPTTELDQKISQHIPPVVESIEVTTQEQKPEPAPSVNQALSLNDAQSSYLNGDYTQAMTIYQNLCKNLSSKAEDELMRDFLQQRAALCMEKTADYEQAGRLFRSVLDSRSPLVRVISNYHLSILEMKNKQYLNARTRAYQAVALIDAVEFDKDWSISLKRNCYFLAAEAITRKALWLCDNDKSLPDNTFDHLDTADDLFSGLDAMQLRTLLNSGSEQLSKAALSPQIQQLENQSGPVRYEITCNGASIEELLVRFAANAGLDIHWALEPAEIGIRKRAVNLYMSQATAQQFVTAAAGGSGLLAQLNKEAVIEIFNPAESSYVSKQVSLLSDEAISLWQKFLLQFPSDTHHAQAHYCLGLLQAQKGLNAESIAEYKLVANSFSGSTLAPLALLNSSKLKNSLRDYPGARQDLKQLVEQFPDTKIAGEAYLQLADNTYKAGLMDEAARLYSKIYHLSLSGESESNAAMGAGKCFYQLKNYEDAEKWLTRYIKSAKDSKNKDLYSAYFILGKTYLALENIKAACEAFECSLRGGPSQMAKEEYLEIISALVEGYMKQGNFVQAFDTLEDIHSVVLSKQESIEILLLKSKALQAMGLVDKAIAILGDNIDYISDSQLKAKLSLELANCYIKKENFELARQKLAEILVVTEPGPLAHSVALKLAEVCLKLGQDSQAQSVCLQLLDLKPPEQTEQKALELLAKAYNRQKDYDRATLALLGQLER